MPITSLSLKYRPIKIGFLVRDGNIEDLVKAAGINTLLWGGIYNPIIPVSETNQESANQLIELFSVDILFAVSHTTEIDEIFRNNPYLQLFGYGSESIFDSHRKILNYLDSTNIVYYLWEKEFKNASSRRKSNFTLIKWDKNDSCSNLFSLIFGYFPDFYTLKDDFQKNFLEGLKAKTAKIKLNKAINRKQINIDAFTPLTTTGAELHEYGSGTWWGDGVYIGLENDFNDLLYFWNIRASGRRVEFLPRNHIKRFKGFIQNYITLFDNKQSLDIRNQITIYHRGEQNEIITIIKEVIGEKQVSIISCNESMWYGLNIKPSKFAFEEQKVLANSEMAYGRYNVSFALPDKKFLNMDRPNPNIAVQHLCVSIDPISEVNCYPKHTLKLPFISKLNEFYSRELTIVDPFKIRSERNEIAAMIKIYDSSLSIFPISYQKLIEKLFEIIGFNTSISQAGLITTRLIEKLGDLEDGRVFKIRGVRQLLQSAKIEKSIKIGEGTKIICDGGNFQKHENLYIEARKGSKLTPNDTFQFLLKKDFLRAGLELTCSNCQLSNWLSLRELDDIWQCNYCGDRNKTSLQLKNRGDWAFRRNGLFAKDNNQEGAIPVILSLLIFKRILSMQELIYSTSLKLEGAVNCEIDFCILDYENKENIQVGIAECKSGGSKIEQKDIDNMKLVQDKINATGMECFLIFAKTADNYESDEIALFQTLKDERRKFIILSNKQLEPYHPYWELEEKESLPEKHPLSMEDMYKNSLFLYFNQE